MIDYEEELEKTMEVWKNFRNKEEARRDPVKFIKQNSSLKALQIWDPYTMDGIFDVAIVFQEYYEISDDLIDGLKEFLWENGFHNRDVFAVYRIPGDIEEALSMMDYGEGTEYYKVDGSCCG